MAATMNASTAAAVRIVVFPCGCVSRFADHEQAGWTWSDHKTLHACADCVARYEAMRAQADAQQEAEAKAATAPADGGLAPWEVAFLADAAAR